MDYILLASLVHTCLLLSLVISYDIACQFFKNFWRRLQDMPEHLRLAILREKLTEKVPKAHLPPHVKSCHAPFSFNYMPGAGRTSGECIESNWSVLNKAAPSCKEMGPSARRETLDDFCGFHNWRKTIGLGLFSFRFWPFSNVSLTDGRFVGDLLLRRMLDALKNEEIFRAEFKALDSILSSQMPEEVESWEQMVINWERDKTLPCPYEKKDSGTYLT